MLHNDSSLSDKCDVIFSISYNEIEIAVIVTQNHKCDAIILISYIQGITSTYMILIKRMFNIIELGLLLNLYFLFSIHCLTETTIQTPVNTSKERNFENCKSKILF